MEPRRKDPHELDILCSKDKSLSNHPGNLLFRECIGNATAAYEKATDKISKMKITRDIVERLQNDHGCRFLKFNYEAAAWVELSRNDSRDKVGHALRFAVQGLRAPKTTRRQSSSSSSSTSTRRVFKRKPVSRMTAAAAASLESSARASNLSFLTKLYSSSHPGIAKLESSTETVGHTVIRQQQELLQSWTEAGRNRTCATFSWNGASSSHEDETGTRYPALSPSAPSWEPLDVDAPEDAGIFSDEDLNFLTICFESDPSLVSKTQRIER